MGNTRKLLRGHYNITGRRSYRPNLQSIIHQGEHLMACTACMRTLHKEARAEKVTAVA